jgi:hypothetical protein
MHGAHYPKITLSMYSDLMPDKPAQNSRRKIGRRNIAQRTAASTLRTTITLKRNVDIGQ